MGCVIHTYAQHISFVGIPLGRSQEIVDRDLRKKGFKYIQEAYEPAHMYEGTFWIYPKVSVLARTHKEKVTEIIVHPVDSYCDPQKLIKHLNKKYGKYKSMEKTVLLTSFNWPLKYGIVQVTIDKTKQYITLRYIDNTSLYYFYMSSSNNRKKMIYNRIFRKL